MARGVIYAARPPRRRRQQVRGRARPSRRRRSLARVSPLLLLAAAAFIAGVIVADRPSHAARQMVTRYVTAWTHGDVAGMYTLLDDDAHARESERGFAAALTRDAQTATATSMRWLSVGKVHDHAIEVPMIVQTRLWGRLRETLTVPLSGSGSKARVTLASSLMFPGLRGRERLTRHTTLPPRATLLAADGTPLAEGTARTSPIPNVAIQIVGTLGPIPAAERGGYAAMGYPAGTQVGQDGLERIFQSRLAGQVGGTLLAGRRALANAAPRESTPVRTTIVPSLENAAVAALGGQYAGMAVMDPRTGALEAAAGIAFSNLQPPGSTMKIVTSTAALEGHVATLGTTFAYATSADIDGFTLTNAGGEDCGGTLLNSFAVSCNSVFGPLAVKVGKRRFLSVAERFGFNQPSSISGAAEPSIPPASLNETAELGSSGIGQGEVQATPLTMADVAATIADSGRRPVPTLLANARPRFVDVTTPAIAHDLQTMMIAVVDQSDGTGTSAQIPGVQVAGKTGTSQIQNTPSNGGSANSSLQQTDAWFVGYAPVGAPKVVAAALFPNAGAGGAVAAVPVKQVIEAALSH